MKKRPRIIKLHGSLSSHQSFTITEEDYREYPKKYAPLVNTVQQSLIENTFCLIGFSADDPNFLMWTGWIRDNLKGRAPLIYLCGVLNLSTPENKLLEARGIIPLDLSCLIKERYLSEQERHLQSIERFLDFLKDGKPPDQPKWPQSSPTIKEESVEDVHGHEKQNEIKIVLRPPRDDALRLSQEWERQRRDYPRWVICPDESRLALWNEIMHWVNRGILGSIDSLEQWEGLFLLRELNWRFETCLVPINMIEAEIKEKVEVFNPFPEYLDIPHQISRSDPTYSEINWDKIEECWVELVFALARRAREKLSREDHEMWMKLLDKLPSTRPNGNCGIGKNVFVTICFQWI